jgi:hypothetical protein
MSIQRVLLAGLIASLALGMLEMLYGAIAGVGFWSPVVFIAATILRGLQSVATPVEFQPIPVLLGLMGHMMNSVILAFVFSWLIAPRLRGLTALAVGGMVYGLLVFVVMWFGVVPLVDPIMLKLNAVVFAISHLMWGATIGLVLGWRPTAALTPQAAA